MAAILVDEGLNFFLVSQMEAFLGVWGLSVRLFTNDFTPDKLTVLADLTEAVFDGYAAATASVATPADAGPANSHIATMKWDQVTFAGGATTPETIYGWYLTVTDMGATELFFAQRLTTPFLMDGSSATLRIKPKINVRST